MPPSTLTLANFPSNPNTLSVSHTLTHTIPATTAHTTQIATAMPTQYAATMPFPVLGSRKPYV